MLYDPIYGAYTELWAGFSPSIKQSDSGRFIIPWGRFGTVREDIVISLKGEGEGGTGKAKAFFDFCETEVKNYV
jgi:retinol dehydrogenase 12